MRSVLERRRQDRAGERVEQRVEGDHRRRRAPVDAERVDVECVHREDVPVRPVTLGLYSYFGSYVSDWSAVMATAALASIPAIILLAVAQRFVAAGTTGGAVK